MWCDFCKRLLAANEPVWRLRVSESDPRFRAVKDDGRYRSEYGRVYEICRACCDGEKRSVLAEGAWRDRTWLHDPNMKWRPPRPCQECGRPVHQSGRVAVLSNFVCSWECRRRAYWGGRYEPRPAPKGRACAECGERFYPKRTDAKFCSVACKQRAYRAR
jgi:hypothetical protein